MRGSLGLIAALLMGATAVKAQSPTFPDAAASDPVALGWMVGSPPPADKLITANDGIFSFPKTRWSFSNRRQFGPTVAVARGTAPIHPLPRAERSDIDAVSFTPIGGGAAMSWKDSLGVNYTDAIVVLHKGRIVYERYFGVTRPETQHIAFSATKSFVGTIAAALVAEGKLDASAPVARYVPELARSGFGDATVRQVMDMTTGLAYDETYSPTNTDLIVNAYAGGLAPRPADYKGPDGFYAHLVTIAKAGEHGAQFKYRTVNTDALAWIVARVAGKSIQALFEDYYWSKLGMEQDAYLHVDPVGTAFAGGGLSLSLRDLARFGEMMRNGGSYRGQRIIPAAAVADIMKGASPADFAKADYKLLPGWSYRSQWWVSHNEHGAYSARGIHGQALYIDPKAEMVIARFASHPLSANANLDVTSLPAYHALARHLMATPRQP
ncbi:MAG: serine hydrolase [Sphingomonadaceae bacterium]|nr:serine hydrolase [Sphingomonadaceae bacterium]